MRTKLAALAVTAGLVTGGAALTLPGYAFAADSGTSSATSTATVSPDASATERAAARLASLKDALKGLVTDGTLTQSQADKVASTLSSSDALRGPGGGHHGHGGLRPEAVAQVLGITVDQLHTQQEAGKTLTQIADAQGISKADLVSKLVAAAKKQLAADVTAGRLTQAQADSRTATLQADITEKVDRVHQGHGDHDGPPADAPATPGA